MVGGENLQDESKIHEMVHSKDVEKRSKALEELRMNFVSFADKEEVWKDLLALTKDHDVYVRMRAADALRSAFPHVTDKSQATKDLLTLTKAQDRFVRLGAAKSLGTAFPHVTDKSQAWKDLLALTKDQYRDVRIRAAYALESAFPHVTDKSQATKDLLALTKDQDMYVRMGAAYALGTAFPHVTDKSQATKDLLALTKDQYSDVRTYAYHSLGKVYVFKATEAEEKNFRSELEKALEFFEKSSQEETIFNPARFYLPFYRSFYLITFKIDEAREDVQKYLIEAKSAVEGSESNEKLLEVVENLSNALKEAQKPLDFNEMKQDLNAYRPYYDRATELLKSIKDDAPGATRCIRRGLPIIDERIKELLNQIKKDTQQLCKIAVKTEFSEISRSAYKHIESASESDNPIKVDWELNCIIRDFEMFSQNLNTEKIVYLKELINEINDKSPLFEKARCVHNLANRLMILINTPKPKYVMQGGVLNVTEWSTGTNVGGNIRIGDVSGQVAIGQNITQTQTLLALDKKELLDSLRQFQKEAAKLGIPEAELSTVNGDLNAAIKEAEKEKPDASKIKGRFEGALDTIKEVGDTIDKVSKWEWTEKIIKVLGKLGLTILL